MKYQIIDLIRTKFLNKLAKKLGYMPHEEHMAFVLKHIRFEYKEQHCPVCKSVNWSQPLRKCQCCKNILSEDSIIEHNKKMFIAQLPKMSKKQG